MIAFQTFKNKIKNNKEFKDEVFEAMMDMWGMADPEEICKQFIGEWDEDYEPSAEEVEFVDKLYDEFFDKYVNEEHPWGEWDEYMDWLNNVHKQKPEVIEEFREEAKTAKHYSFIPKELHPMIDAGFIDELRFWAFFPESEFWKTINKHLVDNKDKIIPCPECGKIDEE